MYIVFFYLYIHHPPACILLYSASHECYFETRFVTPIFAHLLWGVIVADRRFLLTYCFTHIIILVKTKSSACTSQLHESYHFIFNVTWNGDPYISTKVQIKDTEKLACGVLIHHLPFPGHGSMQGQTD